MNLRLAPLVTAVASFEAERIRTEMCAAGRCKNEWL
jgi:hypothetical protein